MPPYAKVTKPGDDEAYSSSSFTWKIESIPHTASQVIVGYSSGGLEIYQGPAKPPGTYTDNQVRHPGGNADCHTRPRYRKPNMGAAWFTTYTLDTPFKSARAT